jgi:DNA-binding CsgD family transcriptional regulator
LTFGVWASGALGDIEAMHRLASRSVQLAREKGAFVLLTRALHNMAIADLLIGSVNDAETQFAAGRSLVTPQSTLIDLGDLLVLAWRGSGSVVRTEAAAKMREAVARSQGWMLVYIQYAVATLELSVGRYRDASAALEIALGEDSFLLPTTLFPDAVEAAVRSNDRHRAEAALSACEERARISGTSLARGLFARSQALLADGTEAARLYEDALSALSDVRGVSHVARTHLLFGEWLRRDQQRVPAREQLTTALALFDSMGAQNFAQRARSELAATGAKVRRRSVERRDELTPQEAHIARLAAEGATNAEIAADTFISANTVDFHLRKVYRKLQVTSRRQLAGLDPQRLFASVDDR